MSKMKEQGNGLFKNPMTVQIFMHCVNKDRVSVREAQRKLGVNSPSTIHWHLNKLVDAGVLKKESDNNYKLTEKGREMRTIQVPVKQNFWIFKGQLLPTHVFNISFLVTSLLIGLILFTIDLLATGIFFSSVIVVEVILQINYIKKLIVGASGEN